MSKNSLDSFFKSILTTLLQAFNSRYQYKSEEFYSEY